MDWEDVISIGKALLTIAFVIAGIYVIVNLMLWTMEDENVFREACLKKCAPYDHREVGREICLCNSTEGWKEKK
jgi:hypothetical protein